MVAVQLQHALRDRWPELYQKLTRRCPLGHVNELGYVMNTKQPVHGVAWSQRAKHALPHDRY